ncbi:MAG: hypothetical protein HYX56_02400 [Chloroflexi bacterium]|nr:hypothetical protein [Chloroflexota bacterium]
MLVAEMQLGASPSEVSSRITAAPLGGGGTEPVPGSATQRGTGILGLAYQDTLKLSLVSDRDPSMTGVFSLTSGRLVRIAGGNPLRQGVNGDGGPALDAVIQAPWGLGSWKQGALYIAEQADSRLRVVKEGVISTYAGDGRCGIPQNGRATATSICSPGLVAVDSSGNVYVAQRVGAEWIARIDATGTLTTISNAFSIGGLAIDARGDLLVAGASNGKLVRYSGTAISAPPVVVASDLGAVRGLTVGRDGSIYMIHAPITDPALGRVWSVLRLRPRAGTP